MKPKPTLLDCQHEVWYTIPPAEGDSVYCQRCQGYRTVPAIAAAGEYHPDDNWTAFRISSTTIRGVCQECGEEKIGQTVRIKKHFTAHAARKCKPLEIRIREVDLPPNSPAPF